METALELLPDQPKGLQTRPADDVLSIIAVAASDPRVDPAKLTALLELKERIDAKQAEVEFNKAFALASLEMPRVSKRGKIKLVKDGVDKGSIPFATYEDIDRVLRPIEMVYGFTRSFLTEPSAQAGITMTLVLSHSAGHSVRSSRFMPPDPGPGRNAMQAIGSASSYAKRYLTLDMWNIVCEGQDNDGNAAHPITAQQREQVQNMVDACDLKGQSLKAFLVFAGAHSIDTIQEHRYQDVMQALHKKLNAIRMGGQK